MISKQEISKLIEGLKLGNDGDEEITIKNSAPPNYGVELIPELIVKITEEQIQKIAEIIERK
jgi:hypothetical protein